MKAMCLVLLASFFCATAQATIQIALKGKARCVIVTQPGAIPSELRAARELAEHLGKITGASLEVRQATSLQDGESAIVVGPGPVASSCFPEVNLDSLGLEEGVIRSQGNKLLIAGGRPRGTMYAAYHFLQDELGVRWWTPWATKIPHKDTLSVGDLNINLKPAFESRDPFWFPAFDGDWAARNCSNSEHAHLPNDAGGKIIYKGFVHTFFPLVPPDKYFAIHPEWYSLINGKRTADGAQLCTTNPELRDFMVEQVRAWLKESPDARIISISQNDQFGACQCPNCKAIDDLEGSYSGTMITLLNYIASKLGPEFPDVAFDTLAYQYTRHAPKTIRPLPNVIVRLCSIECNFAAPLDDPSNKTFATDIVNWHKLCNRLYVWDYTTDFGHYVQPHPNWFVLGPNVRFFHQNGVKGLFEQGAYQSFGSEMSELRSWLLAQLLWNPYQDDRKLIKEFLEGYYGKAAAKYIMEYMTLMQKASKGYYLSCFSGTNAPFLNFPTLTRAERLWVQAEDAAKSDPDLLWRVKQAHLPVRYSFLVRWTQLRRFAIANGEEWPLSKSRKEVADEWLAVATGPGPDKWSKMTQINEGGVTPENFIAQFNEDPPEPEIAKLPERGKVSAIPADIPGASKECISAQDDIANLWNEPDGADRMADPSASDGIAVWMPGSHHEWAFQIPVAKLPKKAQSGRWKIYVIARVDKNEAADPNSVAFTAGVWDGGKQASGGDLGVKVSDATATYKSWLIGTVDTNKNQYVWAAPTANPGVKAVWIDRVYMVPVK